MEKYILWDLDGTIVNSEDPEFKSLIFSTACLNTGLDFNISEDQYIGHTGLEVFKAVLQANGVTDEKNLMSAFEIWENHAVSCLKQNISMVRSRENIVDIWNTAHQMGIKQAVVTSSYHDIAVLYLKNSGIYENCISIISLDHVKNPKPHPEPYRTAMEILHVDLADCVAVEDGISGVHSAKAAGLYTIAWVKNIDDERFKIADQVTNNLSIDMILQGLKLSQ
ncbi:HAD family hydrolase [Chryseobacterium indologenes]|uniref:HAD family hydrolase n=1 Tax=Chryseobacterium indologenes TaxID=253 RepID=UPI001C09145A|nr:HAD-IA family hydrolase [Chryseobacterium indologenes]MBU3049967.1 HAD family hydrolase [Chryseobacterium indologenes]